MAAPNVIPLTSTPLRVADFMAMYWDHQSWRMRMVFLAQARVGQYALSCYWDEIIPEDRAALTTKLVEHVEAHTSYRATKAGKK